MQPFKTLHGIAAPLLEDDVNTDQIAPIAGGPRMNEDYGKLFFMRRRGGAGGSVDPEFFLNKPQFAEPALLVAGRNFGCGSSRESAVWATTAIGVRCVIARSFADIFRENCLQNGVLPVVLDDLDAENFEKLVVAENGARQFSVDLPTQSITAPDGRQFRFAIPPADKTRLLEGLDDIGLTLKHAADITAFEKREAAAAPWRQRADIASHA